MPQSNRPCSKQRPLSGWPREDFAIGPVPRQALAVGEELIPGDIAWMVPRNDDAPLILWHEAGLSADLAGRANLLASLVSPKHVGAGVRWIRQDTEYPRMGQSTPEQITIQRTDIHPTLNETHMFIDEPHNFVYQNH